MYSFLTNVVKQRASLNQARMNVAPDMALADPRMSFRLTARSGPFDFAQGRLCGSDVVPSERQIGWTG